MKDLLKISQILFNYTVSSTLIIDIDNYSWKRYNVPLIIL